MKFLFFPILFALVATLLSSRTHAQTIQDCDGAIQVCALDYVQALITPGFGATQELITPLIAVNNSCLAAGEQNSTWYQFNVNATGTLEFTISPNTLTDDYDWAVYEITNTGCAGIANGSAPQIVCNYSVFPGPTGLSPAPLGVGTSSDPLEPNYNLPVNVQAGGTYALLVNNASVSASGYAIQFGGTAGLLDNTIPEPVSIQHFDCDQIDTFFLTLSDFVACNSIESNGTDFDVSGGFNYYGQVEAAIPVNCTATGFTNQIKVVLSRRIEFNGTYVLSIVTGVDGNTLLDVCGNATPPGTTINFVVTNIPEVELGRDTSLCDGEVLTLDAGNPGITHIWSTGANTQTVDIVTVPATIFVRVDRNGCFAADSIRISSACSIFVPNAFSPNGDGINDVFTFISAHVATSEVIIYNRWGIRVFYSDVEKQKWDGTDGWESEYPAGVYVYIVRGTYRSGKPFQLTGNVVLMR